MLTYEILTVVLVFLVTGAIVAPITLIQGSFFEKSLHKEFMHKPLWGMSGPYQAHGVTHHTTYKWEESYHIEHHLKQEDADPVELEGIIDMAVWHGPLIIFASTLPYMVLAGWIYSYGFSVVTWSILIWAILTNVAHFYAYHVLHHRMHHRKNDWLEDTWIFKRLDYHHRLHHAHMNKNFNTVILLADRWTGTLITESRRVPYEASLFS